MLCEEWCCDRVHSICACGACRLNGSIKSSITRKFTSVVRDRAHDPVCQGLIGGVAKEEEKIECALGMIGAVFVRELWHRTRASEGKLPGQRTRPDYDHAHCNDSKAKEASCAPFEASCVENEGTDEKGAENAAGALQGGVESACWPCEVEGIDCALIRVEEVRGEEPISMSINLVNLVHCKWNMRT